MRIILTAMLTAALGCGVKGSASDELADGNLVDDADAKADDVSASIFGTWENYDNSGDLELQHLQLKHDNSFDAERWDIDYCPDDDEPSTCSEEFTGTFNLKKTTTGKKVIILDEGGGTSTRYYYQIKGTTLELHEAGVTTWTKLIRI
jgi:hypothetical protein